MPHFYVVNWAVNWTIQTDNTWKTYATSDIYTLRSRQNGRHFTDEIFKCVFLNENVWILIKVSLKFVPKGPINIIAAFVQIMAWHGPGDEPLSELMMVKLLSLKFVPKGSVSNIPTLVQIMAWHRSGDKPLSEPMIVSLLMHICVTQPQCVKY